MKKIKLILMSTLITLLCFPSIINAENADNETIFATGLQGEKLTPDTFIPMIEESKQLQISDISFSESNRANTMTTGTFKTTLTYTDTNKKKHTDKLTYMIYPKEPTLFFNVTNYNATSKKLDVSLYNSNASVYMITEQQNYLLPLDANGNFRGSYNPGTLPKELTFIALDKEGNWSEYQTLTIDTQKVTSQKKLVSAKEYDELISNSKTLAPFGSNRSLITIILLISITLLSILFFMIHKKLSVRKQN
ncbi:hypothetical protein [Vagococcus fluvialis]|uniref:hypothetical protein n=1 Tax=Vagococcus fluvialis TaxID=2738 RepID=UPI003B5B780C